MSTFSTGILSLRGVGVPLCDRHHVEGNRLVIFGRSATREGIRLHSREDFAGMRTAGAVAAEILDDLCEAVRPGVSTGEIDDLKRSTFMPILIENISAEAVVYTNEAGQYGALGDVFKKHDFVVHSVDEYVRGDVHTKTIEGYFLHFQAQHEGRVSALRQETPSPLCDWFRVRYNNRISNGSDNCACRHCVEAVLWKAAHLRKDWCGQLRGAKPLYIAAD